MKEENLNRSKFYEQLETSLFDLERTNQQLVQKSEYDKKRILSMCENIDYLERKCEELSGTLETIRDANNKKRYHHGGKYHHGPDYFSYTGSTDSSEEEVIYSNGFRKRAQSLQDLRDFTPSPYDEFDSPHSHSNSPDLKTSENEFIQTLEMRVEELIQAKKKESDRITQLEAKLRLLTQENSNLQQQLSHVSLEKQEEVNQLRKELENYTNPASSPVSISDKSCSTATAKTNVAGLQSPSMKGKCNSTPNSVPPLPEESMPKEHICRRCAMEINVLNLVNSIEYENDDYSSLEFELARASESLSAESSSLSSMDSPILTHTTAQHPHGIESTFEPGFLDYFFGTNSILKKIHLKRTSDDNSTDDNGTNRKSIQDNRNSSGCEDEDSSLAKDFGIEKYDKVFAEERSSEVKPLYHRKLKLPEKISDESPTKSNFDENMLCDAADVSVGVKSRSKLWWLVWLALMVLGTVQLLWQTTRLLFWFILTALLPRSGCSSSAKSSSSPSIRPSSIFPNNDFKTHCAYFPSSRLHTKVPSASYA